MVAGTREVGEGMARSGVCLKDVQEVKQAGLDNGAAWLGGW